MLKRLDVSQIEAREMDSIAVLDAPPSRFSEVSQWTFAPGGDDLDDFDAAVFEVQGLGSFSVLKYRGQPDGTTSVLTPIALTDRAKRQLLRFVLKSGGLRNDAIRWSNLVAEKPRTSGGGLRLGLKALKIPAGSAPRRKAVG